MDGKGRARTRCFTSVFRMLRPKFRLLPIACPLFPLTPPSVCGRPEAVLITNHRLTLEIESRHPSRNEANNFFRFYLMDIKLVVIGSS